MFPLWTHHPSNFCVDDPELVIHHTRGQYWQSSMGEGFRYGEVLSMLIERIGSDQFLWCCTVRGEFIRTTEEIDLVEWELNVPPPQVFSFFLTSVWEDLVWNRGNDWERLLINGPVEEGSEDVGALVRVPVEAKCVTCHGPLPVKYPKH